MDNDRVNPAWDRMERVLVFRNCEKLSLDTLRTQLHTIVESNPTNSGSLLLELAEEALLWRVITDRIERNIGQDGAFSAGKAKLDVLRGGMYPALDALAKARERFKKAMKEFMEQTEDGLTIKSKIKYPEDENENL